MSNSVEAVAGKRPTTRQERPASRDTVTDPAVRELLDHIAVELAKEYVRLMNDTAGEPLKGQE